MNRNQSLPDNQQLPATLPWSDIITTHSAAGDILLVPFANDATLVSAALECERRVIALVRTPAQRLRLGGRLVTLDEDTRRQALARLGATTKRDTPLDQYINRFYHTACPDCAASTPATAFIWDAYRKAPVEKELVCTACGFQGRAPASESDTKRAAGFEHHGLSYWFILEWLVDVQDSIGRKIAGRRLDEYSPRNLTALADITRKIDIELADDANLQRILQLRLLSALEEGRFHADPANKSRMIERNIWHALTVPPAPNITNAPFRLASTPDAFFEETNLTPNIAIVDGPTRKVIQALPAKSVALILGTPPVLDPDDWIWEQIWARWIFGRAGSGGLQPPIGGWTHHVRALEATIAGLLRTLRTTGRMIFHFHDEDPERASALLMATTTRAHLDEFIYQPHTTGTTKTDNAISGLYQMAFSYQTEAMPALMSMPSVLANAIENVATETASAMIRAQAEPAPHGWLVAKIMEHLARAGLLRQAMTLNSGMSPLTFVNQHVRRGLRIALGDEKPAAINPE